MPIGWQAWRAESLDMWTTLTLTVGQGQQCRNTAPFTTVSRKGRRGTILDRRRFLNGGQSLTYIGLDPIHPLSLRSARERGRSWTRRKLSFQRENDHIYTRIVL